MVTPRTSFRLAPTIKVADRVIRESHARGTERLTVRQVVEYSSNIGTITIAERLGAFGRRRGVRGAIRALEFADPRSESVGESLSRAQMRLLGFPEPELQVRFDRADGGFDRVADLTKERTGQAPSYQRNSAESETAQARIQELLEQPLTADRAVELAFLNNRGLQARLAELGIAESERVRAGRLRNPSFSYGRLREGGAEGATAR